MQNITGPHFILIGASKCATSSIIDWLRMHPNVFITQPKEPNFFNRDDNYTKGLDWYLRYFKDARPDQIRGEGSNLYSALALYPETIERIASVCPYPRLIYAVRDPIDRIRSLWIQLRAQAGGDEVHPDINKAIHRDWDVLIDTSLYDRQLSAFEKRFGADSLRVIFYEDFRECPFTEMETICRHIGVSSDLLPREGPFVNSGAGKTLVSPWLGRARKLPGSRWLRGYLPEDVKGWCRGVLPRVSAKGALATLTDESKRQITEWVIEDSKRLLDRLGRPHGIWPTVRDALAE